MMNSGLIVEQYSWRATFLVAALLSFESSSSFLTCNSNKIFFEYFNTLYILGTGEFLEKLKCLELQFFTFRSPNTAINFLIFCWKKGWGSFLCLPHRHNAHVKDCPIPNEKVKCCWNKWKARLRSPNQNDFWKVFSCPVLISNLTAQIQSFLYASLISLSYNLEGKKAIWIFIRKRWQVKKIQFLHITNRLSQDCLQDPPLMVLLCFFWKRRFFGILETIDHVSFRDSSLS